MKHKAGSPGAALSHTKEVGLYPDSDRRRSLCLSCPTSHLRGPMPALPPLSCLYFAFSKAAEGLLSHAQAPSRRAEKSIPLEATLNKKGMGYIYQWINALVAISSIGKIPQQEMCSTQTPELPRGWSPRCPQLFYILDDLSFSGPPSYSSLRLPASVSQTTYIQTHLQICLEEEPKGRNQK